VGARPPAPAPLARVLPLLLLWGYLVLAGCATGFVHRGDARATTRGPEILVLAGGRSHYFENRSPHCLAYTLPGQWEFATQEPALRAVDGRVVAVTLYANPSGGDGVTQTLAYIIADIEKSWSGSTPSTIEPFVAARAGALLLRFDELTVTPSIAGRPIGTATTAVGQKVQLPHRVVAPLAAGFTLVATVYDDEDARQILATLETTEEPQCWHNLIRKRFPRISS